MKKHYSKVQKERIELLEKHVYVLQHIAEKLYNKTNLTEEEHMFLLGELMRLRMIRDVEKIVFAGDYSSSPDKYEGFLNKITST